MFILFQRSLLLMASLLLTISAFAIDEQKTQALQIDLPVSKFKLENGLTVLLHEDHSIPMVSYHTWYRIGSQDEREDQGTTGAAHMLEHMMFKGSKNYPGKTFDQTLHENGITNNAFTTADYTGYYENLPSNKLELIMKIEVDRMVNLTLDPAELKSEQQVVAEERRWRVDNNPMGLLRELMMSTIYKVHPYKWPVIGHMKDIQSYTAEKLRYFYETFYVPNNAVLVIAGDFKTDQTRKLVEKYYGPLKAKELPKREYKQETPQKVQYNASQKSDVQATTFMVAYQGLQAGHPDSYALDLASEILGTGSSSRLHKKLVYSSQEAMSTFAFNHGGKDPGYFAVGATLKPSIGLEKPLNVIYNEVYKLRNGMVSEAELQKAKNLVMKGMVDSLMTIDGKAQALAVFEILRGDYQQIFQDLELYNKVTAKDIKRVCEKYLNQTQRSIIVLQPKG